MTKGDLRGSMNQVGQRQAEVATVGEARGRAREFAPQNRAPFSLRGGNR